MAISAATLLYYTTNQYSTFDFCNSSGLSQPFVNKMSVDITKGTAAPAVVLVNKSVQLQSRVQYNLNRYIYTNPDSIRNVSALPRVVRQIKTVGQFPAEYPL